MVAISTAPAGTTHAAPAFAWTPPRSSNTTAIAIAPRAPMEMKANKPLRPGA